MTEDTKNAYTSNKKSDTVPSPAQEVKLQFMGDSYDRLKEFPKSATVNLGIALRCVQDGKQPPDSKAVPGLGRSGVYELRDEDESGWYRVIYLKKVRDVIYVLHCFKKTTNQIEKQDIRTIQQRLSQVEELERKEARIAKERDRCRPHHHRKHS